MTHHHLHAPTLIEGLLRCRCGDTKDERTAPFQPHSRTSITAAHAIRPHMGKQRGRVLEFMALRGESGATDEEISEALGLNPSAARPRRVELQDLGYIADSGQRRQTRSGRQAVVWVIKQTVAA